MGHLVDEIFLRTPLVPTKILQYQTVAAVQLVAVAIPEVMIQEVATQGEVIMVAAMITQEVIRQAAPT